MDYKSHYERLIERAKLRVLDGYVEVHHIIPRCIGGSGDQENLVQLTAEEHYVAHQLLHKMHPMIPGLAFSLIAMTGNPNGGRSNKAYGWIRRRHAMALSGVSIARWQDDGYRAKHKASMERVRADPEMAAKIAKAVSAAHKGRVKSSAERLNIAEAGRKRAPRKFSEEARKNMAEARRKTWQERREKGEHLVIAAKTRATRIKNGSYAKTPEQRAKIGLAGMGRVPWNKGRKLK